MKNITGKELGRFITKYEACPKCGQNYLIKDSVLHTTIACKNNMIIRECHDCGMVIKYIKGE